MKCKVCSEDPFVGKRKKVSFDIGSITITFRKRNQKIPQKLFHEHYCLDSHVGIDDWNFTQCETHKKLKKRGIFWQHQLKTFYPLGLNQKEEYLYYHIPNMRVRQSIM